MIAWAVTTIIRPIFREVILQGRWAAVVHTQGALCCSCPRAPRIWSSTQGNKESLRSKWAKHKTPTIWYGQWFPTFLFTMGEFTSPSRRSWNSSGLLSNRVPSKILNKIWRRIKSWRIFLVMTFKSDYVCLYKLFTVEKLYIRVKNKNLKVWGARDDSSATRKSTVPSQSATYFSSIQNTPWLGQQLQARIRNQLFSFDKLIKSLNRIFCSESACSFLLACIF